MGGAANETQPEAEIKINWHQVRIGEILTIGNAHKLYVTKFA